MYEQAEDQDQYFTQLAEQILKTKNLLENNQQWLVVNTEQYGNQQYKNKIWMQQ
jgi:hypothetical protein